MFVRVAHFIWVVTLLGLSCAAWASNVQADTTDRMHNLAKRLGSSQQHQTGQTPRQSLAKTANPSQLPSALPQKTAVALLPDRTKRTDVQLIDLPVAFKDVPQTSAAELADASMPLNDRLPVQQTGEFADHKLLPKNSQAKSPSGQAISPQAPSQWGWLLQTGAALGAVIGLILLLRAIFAKMTGTVTTATRSTAVEVLSRTAIAPRNHLLLVRLGERILVLGESATGLRTLTEIADDQEVAQLLQSVTAGKKNSSSQGFAQLLGKFNHAYTDDDHLEDEQYPDTQMPTGRARDRVSSLISTLRSSGKKGGVG